jgi:hypothetical protein
MPKKKTIEYCRQLAEDKSGQCLSEEYFRNKDIMTWKCDKSHIFNMRLNNVQQGQWCPECAKEQRKNTWLKNHGSSSPFGSKEIQAKVKSTILEKYGTTSTLLIPEIKEKAARATIELYGVENVFQSAEIQEQIKKTNIKKYGVDNPMKNHEIALKSAKSANKSVVLKNWKTKKEQVCIGSYEERTVNNLNENRTEYKWQPKTFTMPDGRTYRPDLYLTKERKWIEIKGYFYDDAEEKWNWFHETYPNSELWNEKKLKEMRIL